MKKRFISIAAVFMMSLGMTVDAVAQEAIGQKNVDNTPWRLDQGHVYGGTSQSSGARMMDPVVIDFNDDGIDDIVFGTPGMSTNGIASAGSVYVVLGRKNRPFEGKLDVTSWDSFDYRFDGHIKNGQLGLNLVAGDFNGDGLKDFAVAEPGQKGGVYIFYSGQSRKKGIFDVNQKGGADVSFVTNEPNSLLGLSMCVGDFNHDGIDDLAIASVTQSSYGNFSRITMLTMRREWDRPSLDIGSKIYGKTVINRSVSANVRVVHSCAVGDFNDDGIADIALGMPLDSYQGQKNSGSVTVIYHPFKYNGTVIDIGKVEENVGIRVNGDQANAQFGYALASADFTGDGRDDLAVSAPGRLITGPDSEGAVFIYDASAWPKKSIVQEHAFQIDGKGGMFGFRLKAEDINADTRKDLLILSPYAGSQGNGAISAYLCGPHFSESLKNNMRADIEVDGLEFMQFGLGMALGDVNGDGKTDAVVRLGADPDGREMTGALAVLGTVSEYPAKSTLSSIFLTIVAPSQGGGLVASTKDVSYQNKQYRAWFSPKGGGNRSLICLMEKGRSSAEDVSLSALGNCDVMILGPENYEISDFAFSNSPQGKPLLTIAVPQMPVKDFIGFVSVIPLPETMSQPLALNLNENTLASNARTYMLKEEGFSLLGKKIEWRDLDNDGYEDLVIGAPKRVIDTDTSGTIFIVKGSAEISMGIAELNDPEKIIQFEGFDDEELGDDWIILDINGDGNLDLVAHAAHAVDASGEEYASLYVIYAAGKKAAKTYGVKSPELAALRIRSPQSRAGLDIIPQTVDLDGNGYDDLILLSPDYRAGLQRQGAVYVVYANEGLKGGDLDLSNESHSGFSFIPGRNERIIDVRFARISSDIEFLIITSDLTTGTMYTLSAFVDTLPNVYNGHTNSTLMTRTISDAKMPVSTRWILFADPDKKQDEVWLLFPYDGIRQSGQGVARKVIPWTPAVRAK